MRIIIFIVGIIFILGGSQLIRDNFYPLVNQHGNIRFRENTRKTKEIANLLVISGVVVDSNDSPIEGAVVSVMCKKHFEEKKSDKSGRFVIEFIKYDDTFSLHIEKDGYAPCSSDFNIGEALPAKFILRKLCTLNIKILSKYILTEKDKMTILLKTKDGKIGYKFFDMSVDSMKNIKLKGVAEGGYYIEIQAEGYKQKGENFFEVSKNKENWAVVELE